MAELDQKQEIQEQPATAEGEVLNVEDNEEQKPLYNKRQMSDVVKRERDKAFEKGKRAMLEQMQSQQQQPVVNAPEQAPNPSVMQQAPNTQGLGGMQQISPDDIRRMIAEETPRHLQSHIQQTAAQRTAEGFVQKMRAAEARHPGLEAKLNELDYTHLSPLIHMVDKMENPGDIMKELVDNPMKMGNLVTLLHTQPRLAEKAMIDLSNSIKQNQDALSQESSANEPFERIKPSKQGMDNGSATTTDYRKQDWMRG